MRDIYTETVVPIARTTRDQILKWLFITLTAASAVMTLLAGMIFLIPALGFGFLLYRTKDREDREYEYIHTNDDFDIDMIIRSSKRKKIAALKLREVLMVAPADSAHIDQFGSMPIHDYSGGQGSDGLYAMVCRREGKYGKFLLRLDGAMVKSLKQWMPDRVKN